MNHWIRLAALLAVAGFSLVLGVQPEAGSNHFWLMLSLAATFAASDAKYWRRLAGD